MASVAIPKEQLSAYERWEMTAFTESNQSASTAKLNPKDVNTNQKPNDMQAVNQVLEGLRKEAYEKGLTQGYNAGLAKAREQVQSERTQLQGLVSGLKQALENADEVIAEDLLALALDIAKAMLKTKIAVDANAILPVITEAMHYLPHVQKPARIIVNHEDATLLRTYLAEELSSENWQVVEDNHIEKGGCLVETGANQIDASNEIRWKRITEALSQRNDWLLP